ncbi:unnamed protein product, partial [Polarella glacialis]
DACLWAACAEVLLPAARRFKPDILLVSAGFDAAAGDPLGGARCTPRGFGLLARELCSVAESLCGGRLILALEGGYEPHALMACVAEVTTALMESPPSSGDAPLRKEPFSPRGSSRLAAEALRGIRRCALSLCSQKAATRRR